MILGMIPDCDLARVTSAGNAAGTGARIALLNVAARREVEALVTRIHKVETAIEPRFQEHFVAANAIPHATAPFPHLAPLPDVSFNADPGAPPPPRLARFHAPLPAGQPRHAGRIQAFIISPLQLIFYTSWRKSSRNRRFPTD